METYLVNGNMHMWCQTSRQVQNLKQAITDLSLTSTPCQVLKSITRDILLKHLEGNKLLSNEQLRFRCNRSCLTNLLKNMNELGYLMKNLECRIFGFDIVSHRKHTSKLETCNFDMTFLWSKCQSQTIKKFHVFASEIESNRNIINIGDCVANSDVNKHCYIGDFLTSLSLWVPSLNKKVGFHETPFFYISGILTHFV